MKLKWLTNGPREPSLTNLAKFPQQDAKFALKEELEWRRDKVIGRPKATRKYSVEELEAQDMVGIYMEVKE